LAGNVLQARIEANDQQIVAMLKSRSEDEGLTIEEFIKKIVNDSDDDQEKPTR
jgi:parvulin-like peptidyl-prolyl isomerase